MLTNMPVLQRRYLQSIAELHGCFRERITPDMPFTEGREGLLAELLGTQVSEALWLLAYLHRSILLPGDLCEFGIAQGCTSALIANEIRQTNKKLWLFDSFQGLSKPTKKDILIDDIFNLGSMAAYEGAMKCPVAEVKQRLNAIKFPNNRVEIVPGFIEETIRLRGLPETVCFAYVDFDFYEPILLALDFLARAISIGGTVLVDDYGFFSAGAQAAVDEFVEKQKGAFELILPPAWSGHFAILTKTR
jgi:O-methyltransferase